MCSRPFRPLGFAHLCHSRPRGSILAPTLVTLPSVSRVPYAPFTKTESPDYAPAMLDRYLAALRAMSLIPFAPFFNADSGLPPTPHRPNECARSQGGFGEAGNDRIPRASLADESEIEPGKGKRIKEAVTDAQQRPGFPLRVSLLRFRMVTKIAVSSSHSCRKGASFSALTTPDSRSSSSQ